MLCEKCKNNQANVSVQTMFNGNSESHHLCSECAQNEGLFFSGFSFENFPMANQIGKTFFNFPFSKIDDSKQSSETVIETDLHCPGCNQSLNDFKKSGLFGCAQCYGTFRELIRTMLDQVQGTHFHQDAERATSMPPETSHEIVIEGSQATSKSDSKPDSSNINSKKKALRAELHKLVEQEKYEQAAVLRDQIKSLDEKEVNEDEK